MKQAKGKGKARAEEDDEDEDESASDAEGAELKAEEEEDEAIEAAEPALVGKKTTYLDDALFAEAAAHYEPDDAQTAGGLSKKAQKALVKEEKRRKREMIEEREAEIREGGRVQAGYVSFTLDLLLQHG